jgi:hypothetical protein
MRLYTVYTVYCRQTFLSKFGIARLEVEKAFLGDICKIMPHSKTSTRKLSMHKMLQHCNAQATNVQRKTLFCNTFPHQNKTKKIGKE